MRATLTKKYVTFSLEMELTFTYSSGWNEPSIETNAKLENFDITGEWTGNYTAAEVVEQYLLIFQR